MLVHEQQEEVLDKRDVVIFTMMGTAGYLTRAPNKTNRKKCNDWKGG